MTDFFALLGQPQQPWLDADELKQAFHARSLQSHPDAQPGSTSAKFQLLNEAYQTLQDPKRRLQHLLALAGAAPQAAGNAVPREIEELFPLIAALTQEVTRVLGKNAAATSSLTRSLLRGELVQVQQRLAEALAILQRLEEESTARLQELSASWDACDAATVAELHQLYLRFSYLTRWIGDVREKQLQLANL